jgi:hypothetical protein
LGKFAISGLASTMMFFINGQLAAFYFASAAKKCCVLDFVIVILNFPISILSSNVSTVVSHLVNQAGIEA